MPAASKPILFIGSSKEGLPVARHLQAELADLGVCEVERWDQDVFEPSRYALESLLDVAQRVDFAVLVASPDDVTETRGHTEASVRDNIVLEFGLFAGALGRKRTYLLATGEARLPTDTLGLTRLPYHPQSGGNYRAAVNAAVLKIEQQVERHGRRTRVQRSPGHTGSEQAALDREIDRLCANAKSQGWTVKTNSATTLRLVPPNRKGAMTLTKSTPTTTRTELRRFAARLRAAGLRVNCAVRRPVEESPY